ncbi:MAG: hypothetical protein HOM11_10540 [Methylococcales bacterium]|jgi:hypothetical protein|nr:hypothetical protein [Methylococcales bacterium]MBT7443256.1 hypothetical protein [Methylococcales bacterium]
MRLYFQVILLCFPISSWAGQVNTDVLEKQVVAALCQTAGQCEEKKVIVAPKCDDPSSISLSIRLPFDADRCQLKQQQTLTAEGRYLSDGGDIVPLPSKAPVKIKLD